MGVLHLWDNLEPVAEVLPIEEALNGVKLAVDLSGWVCQSLLCKPLKGVVRKPHIRNLFFKTVRLLNLRAKLVFVLEGEAPAVKSEALEKRFQQRLQQNAGIDSPSTSDRNFISREMFNYTLEECKALLESLGVQFIQAVGEAESTCAYLNKMGFVDGCLTNDSDVFLYGARTVFRMQNSDAKLKTITKYDMNRIETELGLSQRKLVALGLLVGCDYAPGGVTGIGPVNALKLLKKFGDIDPLQRFENWKDMKFPECVVPEFFKPPHCTSCHHPGKWILHKKSGCKICETDQLCQKSSDKDDCPCDYHKKVEEFGLEYKLKEKASKIPNFPNNEIVNEFLVDKENFEQFDVFWAQPDHGNFEKLMFDHLGWTPLASLAKILPVLTLWQILTRIDGKTDNCFLEPQSLKKKGKKFEVTWKHIALPSFELSPTEEDPALFSKAYKDLTNAFILSENKSKLGLLKYFVASTENKVKILQSPKKGKVPKIKRLPSDSATTKRKGPLDEAFEKQRQSKHAKEN